MAVYGSLAEGSPVAYPGSLITPALAQSLSAFDTGMDGCVIANSSPPLQDHNSLFYTAFYQLAYLMQEGIPEYDGSTTYYSNSIVQASPGILYASLTGSNIGNPPVSGSPWIPFAAQPDGSTLEISGSVLQIKALPAKNSVTANHTGGSVVGSTTVSFGATGSLTVSGGPVLITVQGQAGSAQTGFINLTSSDFSGDGYLVISRSGTDIHSPQIGWNNPGASGAPAFTEYWPLSISTVDFPAAGTYIYSLSVVGIPPGGVGSSQTITISDFTITAVEL